MTSFVGGRSPLLCTLLATNGLSFGIYQYHTSWDARNPYTPRVRRFFSEHMTLSNKRVRRNPWVSVTHLFHHTDVWHFGLNMMTLWSMGHATYVMLGTARFVALYFVSGLTGAAVQLTYHRELSSPSFPSLRGLFPAASRVRYDDSAIGASAAIAGCVCYYATRNPSGRIILFVVPVPNRVFVLLFLAGSMYGAFCVTDRSLGGQWAHAAHLGGASVGITYALLRKLARK